VGLLVKGVTGMSRALTVSAALGMAATALAIAGPSTVHASFPSTSGGVCSNGRQSTGSGTNFKHSFDSSHNNCIDAEGSDDYAGLHNSNFNQALIYGNDNYIDDLVNSTHNAFTFARGNGGGNTLDTCVPGSNDTFTTTTCPGSNYNNVTFSSIATNDYVYLIAVGTSQASPGVTAVIDVSGDFLEFTSGCDGKTVDVTSATTFLGGMNTASSPLVVC
jgi:hypothetical protein